MTAPDLSNDVFSTIPPGHSLTLVGSGSLSQQRGKDYGHRATHWNVKYSYNDEPYSVSNSLPGCLSRLVKDANRPVDPALKTFEDWIAPHKEWLAQLSELCSVCIPIGARTTIFCFRETKTFDLILGIEADFDLHSQQHNKIQKNVTNLSWDEVIKHLVDVGLNHEMFDVDDFNHLSPINQERFVHAIHTTSVQNALTAALSKMDLQAHLGPVSTEIHQPKARKI